jgi:hypothetical protein
VIFTFDEEVSMNTLSRVTLPFVTLAALLSACGGGGGGAEAPPVIAPGPVVTGGVDVAAAWRDYLSVAHTWTMSGKTSDARAFDLSVVMKPGANRSFALTGATGQTIDQSIRLTIAGATTVSDGTLFFNGAAMVGLSTTNGACFGLRGAMPVLPGASAVGSSGAMFVLDGNAGCSTGGQKLGTTTYNWSVEKDGALTMFCLTALQVDAKAGSIGSDVYCFEAGTGGTLGAKAKFTITRPDGTTLSGRNF